MRYTNGIGEMRDADAEATEDMCLIATAATAASDGRLVGAHIGRGLAAVR